jgi:PEP-CTERM motif
MKSLLTLSLAVVALSTTVSAQAVIIDAKFSGKVTEQVGTTFAVNAAISGQFLYDTDLSKYTSFVIGGLSVAPGYSSIADMTPDRNTVLYEAQVSALNPGVTVNNTFKLNLEAGGNPFPAVTAIALLTNSGLASNLDPLVSSFGYYTANANGTNIKSLSASLTSLTVTAVPEPSTALMLAAGAAVLALSRLRKTRC